MEKSKMKRIMHIYNQEELKSYMKRNSNKYDAIASVISSWHLANLLALVKAKSYKSVCCIVSPEYLSKEKSKFRLLDKDLITYESIFSEIIFLHININGISPRELYLFLIEKRKNIVYINPGLRPNLKLLISLAIKPCCFCAIDEGLGTYISVSSFKKNLPYTMQHNIIFDWIKECIIKIINNHFLKKQETFYLFNRQNTDELIVNTQVASLLRSIYNSYSKSTENIVPKKNIFILTDYPFVEYKYLEPFFKAIFSIFHKKIDIFIKKHPNDVSVSLEKLSREYSNITFLNISDTAEMLVARYKPLILIGGYTTSLFSCSSIFNIKAVSYIGLYEKMGISKTYQDEIVFFKKAFKKNKMLFFIQSQDSLLHDLNNIINEEL